MNNVYTYSQMYHKCLILFPDSKFNLQQNRSNLGLQACIFITKLQQDYAKSIAKSAYAQFAANMSCKLYSCHIKFAANPLQTSRKFSLAYQKHCKLAASSAWQDCSKVTLTYAQFDANMSCKLHSCAIKFAANLL